MKRWGVFAAVSVFLLALTGAPAAAQPADCPPVQGITCDGWVTDAAGVIEDDAGLESLVSGVVQNFGRQIAVVIVDSTGSTSASSFAQDIGNTWGVGLAGEDDGVVVLIAVSDRWTQIEHGPGVDLNPDAISTLGNASFASGDFDGGVAAIVGGLSATFEAQANGESDPFDSGGSGTGWVVAAVGLGTAGVVGATALRARNRERQKALDLLREEHQRKVGAGRA